MKHLLLAVPGLLTALVEKSKSNDPQDQKATKPTTSVQQDEPVTTEDLLVHIGYTLDSIDDIKNQDEAIFRAQMLTLICAFAAKSGISSEVSAYITDRSVKKPTKSDDSLAEMFEQLLAIPAVVLVDTKDSLLSSIRQHNLPENLEEQVAKYFASGTALVQKFTDAKPIADASKFFQDNPILSSVLSASFALLKGESGTSSDITEASNDAGKKGANESAQADDKPSSSSTVDNTCGCSQACKQDSTKKTQKPKTSDEVAGSEKD